METYTLDDIKKEVYGEIGTPRRDKIEAELASLRVGIQIRNAREARKMTQSQLAEKIGKERSFISKVESDGKNLTLSTLYDIVTKGLGGKLNIQVQL
ncbi:helix-turn-helix domain protein [Phocaeicola salanitronis DSM 18170]|jgi:ribosome-binding protein aMBF1 (putative translation factor)|uniref:Helix-turn-helix domain protein n=1 Tax=Phocaeicola salanitronis (strain DSM 18170 / JCM 13657 / CCUG 60908 / BL78) TaxID=667015 RepID=F0R6L3_PHOSB|nr:helix-turn-helix transcriptional regulator [Phocaeicola salanitronis]ADY36901.1 helix-turn-helix domain protein [Phocaeicola salanitronis DSM 18170]